MSDEVVRILMESRGVASLEQEDLSLIAEEDFDEQAYLKRNPDVAQCVAQGMFPSGYHHYKNYGKLENRPLFAVETGLRGKITFPAEAMLPNRVMAALERISIDALVMSSSGGIMVIGWADDMTNPIDSIVISCVHWKLTVSAATLIRVRRQDVEAALGGESSHSYGFFGLHFEKTQITIPISCEVTIVATDGRTATITVSTINHTDFGLREVALSYLAEAKFFGNYQLEAITNVSHGFGNHMISLNRSITNRFVANPYTERFGFSGRPLRGSIVVCLYGRAEYLFLQSALFSNQPGMDEYEFIYVSNSPELAETLLREAKIAATIYDQRITIVLLEGNAGFGAANNAAAKAAQSNRILTVNPDVFPRDKEWALKHSRLLDERPKEETQIFGVPLYYDDGSLMHGGMYFELDSGVLMQQGAVQRIKLVRVEHYGKGAPESLLTFTRSRPIQAVTGAFISSDRDWYENLGGFTEDYVFGHYEDADLCLKSMVSGTMPWMHDLRLWHLEGKGSTRRPVHEGGSLVNRWLFSARWAGLIENALLGTHPDLGKLKRMLAETVRHDASRSSVNGTRRPSMQFSAGNPLSQQVDLETGARATSQPKAPRREKERAPITEMARREADPKSGTLSSGLRNTRAESKNAVISKKLVPAAESSRK